MQNHPEAFTESVCRKLAEVESKNSFDVDSDEMSIINTGRAYSAIGTIAFTSGSWILCRKLFKFNRFPSFLSTICLALPLGFALSIYFYMKNTIPRVLAQKKGMHQQGKTVCKLMHCMPYYITNALSKGNYPQSVKNFPKATGNDSFPIMTRVCNSYGFEVMGDPTTVQSKPVDLEIFEAHEGDEQKPVN